MGDFQLPWFCCRLISLLFACQDSQAEETISAASEVSEAARAVREGASPSCAGLRSAMTNWMKVEDVEDCKSTVTLVMIFQLRRSCGHGSY